LEDLPKIEEFNQLGVDAPNASVNASDAVEIEEASVSVIAAKQSNL